MTQQKKFDVETFERFNTLPTFLTLPLDLFGSTKKTMRGEAPYPDQFCNFPKNVA